MSCQKVVEAIGAELFNDAFRNEKIGAIKLGLSPQNNRELNMLAPNRSDGTVSFVKEGGQSVPKVTFRHLDFTEYEGDNDVNTSPSCSAEELDYDTKEVSITLRQFAEKPFKISELSMNTLCQEINDLHEKQVNSGRSFSSSFGTGLHSEIVNAKLIQNVQKILKKANEYALDNLLDGIGANPLHGNSTAAQEVPLFTTSEEKGMTMHLDDEIRSLWREKGYFGRPIIATGSHDLVTWFNRMCQVGCCSSAGIDYSRVVASGYEVYFISELVDLLGPDEFLIMAPKTFFFLTVDRWRNVKATLKKDQIAQSKIGYFAIKEPSVRSLDSACFQEGGEPTTRFDLRLREQDCDNDAFLPALAFFPSLTYDTFTRPEDSRGVTGIFRYKIKNYKSIADTTFRVSFNSNGGSAVAPVLGVESGARINEPADPTRTGFTFEGWFLDSALTQAWTFSTDEITGDTTLYAKWED